jgi:hypothetical protein
MFPTPTQKPFFEILIKILLFEFFEIKPIVEIVHFYNVFKQMGKQLDMIIDVNHNENAKWGHSCQIKYSKYVRNLTKATHE